MTVFTDAMSEAELQAAVIEHAETHGWLVFHDNDSRRNNAGFPDLVLVKPPRIWLIELKSEEGRTRPEQQVWLDALAGCDTVASALIRPSQLDALARRLAKPEDTTNA